jgi:PKD repeat protein
MFDGSSRGEGPRSAIIPLRPARLVTRALSRPGWPAVALVVLVVLSMVPLASGLASGLTPDRATPAAPRGSTAVPGTRAPDLSSSEVLPMVPEPAGVRSACVDPSGADRFPTSSAGYLELEGNLWNMSSNASGGADLCYNAATGTMSEHTDVDTPGASTSSVVGFPEALFGQRIFGGPSGVQNPALPLPTETVSNVTADDVWATVNYSVQIVGRTPYNLAFDDWLTQIPANGTPGRDPGNRIEVMVWFSTNLNRSWTTQESVSIPSFVNGSADPREWERDQWCFQNNSQIVFDYYYDNTPNNLSGVTQGDLAVNLSAVFANVEQYVATDSHATCYASAGTNISGYYVANLAYGVEVYQNPTKGYFDEEESNWSLNSWCYTLVAGTPTGAGTDCATSAASPVTATATTNVTSGVEPLRVGFTGTVGGGVPPFAYRWSFGNGLGSASTPNANFTFDEPGTYGANLTVADYDDIVTSVNVTLTVLAPAGLSVTLTASPSSAAPGSQIHFAATVSGGRPPFEFRWWGLPTGPGCVSSNSSTVNCTAESNGTWEVVVGVNDFTGYAQASTNVSISPTGSTGPPPANGGGAKPYSPLGLEVGALAALVVAVLVVAWVVRARGKRPDAETPSAPPEGASGTGR